MFHDKQLKAAMTAARRERPEIVRNDAMIIAAISAVAERRPDISGAFIAHTTVLYADSRVEGDIVTPSTLADSVIAQWDMEAECDLDERRSAGLMPDIWRKGGSRTPSR